MAIFNTAFCGMGGCNIAPAKNTKKKHEEVSFEEIK